MSEASSRQLPVNPFRDSHHAADDGNLASGRCADELCRAGAQAQTWEGSGLQVTAFTDLHNMEQLAALAAQPAINSAHLLGLLYLRFGTDLPAQLTGSFAFCITDLARQQQLLATDRFGIKPVVYAFTAQGLCWGSRIQTVLAAAPQLGAELDPAALVDYLNLSAIPSPKTIYKAIHKLPPGHLLLTAPGADVAVKPYYQIDYAKQNVSDASLLEQIPGRIEAAVARSLTQADRQGQVVGAFLSGGTDSSTVVGMLKKLTGSARAFAIGFDEPGYNELGYARIAARHFGAELHEYTVTPQDVLDAIDLVAEVYDEPFGNSSVIPSYFCAKLARKHGINTLLAGDGGDEIFGGNERYAGDKIFGAYGKLPRLLRTGIIEPLTHALPAALPLVAKGRKYLRRANIPLPDRFYSYYPVNALGLEQVFSTEFLEHLGPYDTSDWARELFHDARASDDLDRLLHLDVKFTLTDNDLRKVSGMVERAGARVAYPFLDHALVDFAAALPVDLKVRGSKLRYGFKAALADFLPGEIIAKQKHGFGLPVGLWSLTQPKVRNYFRDLLLDPGVRVGRILREGFVEDVFHRHSQTTAGYYGDVLWMLLVLELWAQKNQVSF